MNGYQISLFTQQDQRHHHQPLADWLVQLAKELGFPGATVFQASESLGHGGRIHSAHFFELADQPLEVVMAVSEAQSAQLFARLREEKLRLFYVRAPVEFGVIGDDASL
jgi:PII-like signaling protein